MKQGKRTLRQIGRKFAACAVSVVLASAFMVPQAAFAAAAKLAPAKTAAVPEEVIDVLDDSTKIIKATITIPSAYERVKGKQVWTEYITEQNGEQTPAYHHGFAGKMQLFAIPGTDGTEDEEAVNNLTGDEIGEFVASLVNILGEANSNIAEQEAEWDNVGLVEKFSHWIAAINDFYGYVGSQFGTAYHDSALAKLSDVKQLIEGGNGSAGLATKTWNNIAVVEDNGANSIVVATGQDQAEDINALEAGTYFLVPYTTRVDIDENDENDIEGSRCDQLVGPMLLHVKAVTTGNYAKSLGLAFASAVARSVSDIRTSTTSNGLYVYVTGLADPVAVVTNSDNGYEVSLGRDFEKSVTIPSNDKDGAVTVSVKANGHTITSSNEDVLQLGDNVVVQGYSELRDLAKKMLGDDVTITSWDGGDEVVATAANGATFTIAKSDDDGILVTASADQDQGQGATITLTDDMGSVTIAGTLKGEDGQPAIKIEHGTGTGTRVTIAEGSEVAGGDASTDEEGNPVPAGAAIEVAAGAEKTVLSVNGEVTGGAGSGAAPDGATGILVDPDASGIAVEVVGGTVVGGEGAMVDESSPAGAKAGSGGVGIEGNVSVTVGGEEGAGGTVSGGAGGGNDYGIAGNGGAAIDTTGDVTIGGGTVVGGEGGMTQSGQAGNGGEAIETTGATAVSGGNISGGAGGNAGGDDGAAGNGGAAIVSAEGATTVSGGTIIGGEGGFGTSGGTTAGNGGAAIDTKGDVTVSGGEISGGAGGAADVTDGGDVTGGAGGAAIVSEGGKTNVVPSDEEGAQPPTISGGAGGAGAGAGAGGAGAAAIETTGETTISGGEISGGAGGASNEGTAGSGGTAIDTTGTTTISGGEVSGGEGGASDAGAAGSGGTAIETTGATTVSGDDTKVTGGAGGNSTSGNAGDGGAAIDATVNPTVSEGAGVEGGAGGTSEEGASGKKSEPVVSMTEFQKVAKTIFPDLGDGALQAIENDKFDIDGIELSKNDSGGYVIKVNGTTESPDTVRRSLNIPDKLGNLTIDLNGKRLVGLDGENAINVVSGGIGSKSTELVVKGPGTIQGGAGGGNAIGTTTGGTIDISVQGATLQGGAGADATEADSDGGNGGSAIAGKANVTVEGDSKLVGGNGGSGGNEGAAGNGGSAIQTSGKVDVKDGEISGGNGGNGPVGGNGGSAVQATGSDSVVIEGGELSGGNGGKTEGGNEGGAGAPAIETSLAGGVEVKDGKLSGGAGGESASGNGGPGGAAIASNDVKVAGGELSGGAGGAGGEAGGEGGAGVSGLSAEPNSGNTVIEGGSVQGGAGGESASGTGGPGGAGVVSQGAEVSGGSVSGGQGGTSEKGAGGAGGFGVESNNASVSGDGTQVVGGAGGEGATGGAGGSGVNAGEEAKVSGGSVSGGQGGHATGVDEDGNPTAGGTGGAGISGGSAEISGGDVTGGKGGTSENGAGGDGGAGSEAENNTVSGGDISGGAGGKGADGTGNDAGQAGGAGGAGIAGTGSADISGGSVAGGKGGQGGASESGEAGAGGEGGSGIDTSSEGAEVSGGASISGGAGGTGGKSATGAGGAGGQGGSGVAGDGEVEISGGAVSGGTGGTGGASESGVAGTGGTGGAGSEAANSTVSGGEISGGTGGNGGITDTGTAGGAGVGGKGADGKEAEGGKAGDDSLVTATAALSGGDGELITNPTTAEEIEKVLASNLTSEQQKAINDELKKYNKDYDQLVAQAEFMKEAGDGDGKVDTEVSPATADKLEKLEGTFTKMSPADQATVATEFGWDGKDPDSAAKFFADLVTQAQVLANLQNGAGYYTGANVGTSKDERDALIKAKAAYDNLNSKTAMDERLAGTAGMATPAGETLATAAATAKAVNDALELITDASGNIIATPTTPEQEEAFAKVQELVSKMSPAQQAAFDAAFKTMSGSDKTIVQVIEIVKVQKEEAQKAAAAAAAAAAAEKKRKSVKTVTVNVATVNAATVNAAVAKAGGSNKYVTTIVLGAKVKKIAASAFKAYSKVTVLQVKTTKLKKASVKGSLKGSKIKTVKVPKKKLKAYKKIFTKKVAGLKVKVSK